VNLDQFVQNITSMLRETQETLRDKMWPPEEPEKTDDAPPAEQPTAESASEEAETADRPSPESETKAPERPSSETEDSAVPPPRVNIIVEQVTPEVSSAEFSSLHDVPRPFVPPETAEPASVVLPIKENYKWFRVTDLLGDKLPSIRKGSWLLVDTRIREQYERNDLILIGNDNNEVQDGIQVEPYIATPAYNRISLRRVLSSGGFTRDQSGRVIFKVPGLPSTNIVLGVVLAIWTSPLQSTSK
jgi:hypothetical protein